MTSRGRAAIRAIFGKWQHDVSMRLRGNSAHSRTRRLGFACETLTENETACVGFLEMIGDG